jgi:hypothetical protein
VSAHSFRRAPGEGLACWKCDGHCGLTIKSEPVCPLRTRNEVYSTVRINVLFSSAHSRLGNNNLQPEDAGLFVGANTDGELRWKTGGVL